MRKRIIATFIIILSLSFFSDLSRDLVPVRADELTDTQNQIEQKKNNLNNQQSELEKKKAEEGSLAYEYSVIKGQMGGLQQQLNEKTTVLQTKEEELKALGEETASREAELNKKRNLITERIRSLYKKTQNPPLLTLFSETRLANLAQDYAYRVTVMEEDKETALELSAEIEELNLQKQKNEETKKQIEKEKESLNQNIQQTQEEISYTNARLQSNRSNQSQMIQQLAGLQNEITQLSQKEQEILAAKAAAAAAKNTVGNTEQAWTPIAENALCDAGMFSVWTYGYPHRVGMNQYGAYGRALAGQSVGDILHAYYSSVNLSGIDADVGLYTEPSEIKVDGYGWISFDQYLNGIGEMPSSWPTEALKAQAIASRTYALNYINYASYATYENYRNDPNARSICTDQRCQVYLGHPKEASWQSAVSVTKGIVILTGGVPITAWYASTAGGATLSSEEVWGGSRSYVTGIIDTNSQGAAYDGPGLGNSPWYHKAWGDLACLSKAEIMDLLNAALLPASHQSKLPSAANGGFTPEEVIDALNKEGINSITDFQSIYTEVGAKNTTELSVINNGTTINIKPAQFKFVFNLRSPGTDAIWTTKYDIQAS